MAGKADRRQGGRHAGQGAPARGSFSGARPEGRGRRRDKQIVRTATGRALVFTMDGPDGEPVRVLQQGGVFQSATYLDERRFEPVFAYYRGFDALFEAEPELRRAAGHGVRRVALLGGGGFSYPKHLLTAHEGIALDVVELDASIVRLARRWFFLDELEARLARPDLARGNSLRINVASARAYLETVGPHEGPYDAIINDTFVGAEPARGLATLEAARAVRRCLGPGGVYLMNVVSRSGGSDLGFLRDEVATLLQVFARVHVLDVSDERFGAEANYLLLATDGAACFAGDIAYDKSFPGRVLRDFR